MGHHRQTQNTTAPVSGSLADRSQAFSQLGLWLVLVVLGLMVQVVQLLQPVQQFWVPVG
jgi:hypothetical protein